ncbi:hypothetical protein OIU79_012031 [Salix purpurea]|uniref:Uncharacterized protein n=1 Tax=Salix purpurea TaxID=77065 RepID=A0A9Q0Q227_SALPP|nr:hypothetical protein OIU79_012031 [Salix purpurea]
MSSRYSLGRLQSLLEHWAKAGFSLGMARELCSCAMCVALVFAGEEKFVEVCCFSTWAAFADFELWI